MHIILLIRHVIQFTYNVNEQNVDSAPGFETRKEKDEDEMRWNMVVVAQMKTNRWQQRGSYT